MPVFAKSDEAVVVQVVAERVVEPPRHDPDRAEGRDERERERNAGEVGCHAGEGRQRRADDSRRAVADRRVRDQKADQAAEQGRDETDLDAGLVRVEVRALEDLRMLLEREPAVVALEGADQDRPAGRKQEERTRREKNGTTPSQASGRTPAAGLAPAAGHDVGFSTVVARVLRPDLGGHSAVSVALAFVCCAGVANLISRRATPGAAPPAAPPGRPSSAPGRGTARGASSP